MPEFQRYVTKVETHVTVSVLPLIGGEVEVGRYVVRAEASGNSGTETSVQRMVEAAMAKVSKNAKVMAAAVDNTERSRLK